VLLFQTVSSETDIAAAIDALIDEYRVRCLWSLRPDDYPGQRLAQSQLTPMGCAGGGLSGFGRAAASTDERAAAR
jgi:hypothetical protein